MPHFTSHVTFELWQPEGVRDAGSFQVRIRYDGELLAEAAGCADGKCAFSDLLAGTLDRVRTPESCDPV